MAMFGATVLVPILTGLDPGVGLMTSGIGTILYLICVRNKIPSYLGSSFAFIAPLIAVGGGPGGDNIPAALGGIVAAGVVYMVVAGHREGARHRLAQQAAAAGAGRRRRHRHRARALGRRGQDVACIPMADPTQGVDLTSVGVAAITLVAAIVFSSFFKGFLKTIPILLGIIVGYVGLDSARARELRGRRGAPRGSGLPTLTFPVFELDAILIIAPVAIVVIIEHIGHLLVINEITGKDFTPMLPESLFGDGLATALSGAVGGTPSTTYAENIGVMAVTQGLRDAALLVRRRARVRHRRIRARSSALPSARYRRRSWAASRCCCSASSPRAASDCSWRAASTSATAAT